ncbi:MAG: sigma-54-dependent Fis family transcriptional regulator [Desulfobulbaceae bacterium]|nr:sigma-54-dependent Fis family transcriptional regulator [Desulfobulbaceae bacterium]
MTGKILIVEDDPTFRGLLAAILEDMGHQVTLAGDGGEGLAILRQQTFDLVLSDLKMPKFGGLELFRAARAELVGTPFVLITAYGKVEEAVAAIKDGVSDFLTKPLPDPDTLRHLVARLLEENRRERRLVALDAAELAGLPPLEILFGGAAMQALERSVRDVAPTEATVLVGGESGTGKELLCRYIHLVSKRRSGPFVVVNCAAIPETLLESELFGHERGAFTGATTTRAGKFEAAAGGTIMLDEIGEMAVSMQVKLLRVLQERTFQRVGGNRELRAEVRVVAASNRDLVKEVAAGRFREDLFYRLSVFPLNLPPLRERCDALDEMVGYFVRQHARGMAKKVPSLAGAVLKSLRDYHWPGNIRELRNVLERAVILARGEITLAELPDLIRLGPEGSSRQMGTGSLRALEREAITAALKVAGGNRRLAAERLGISRRTLQYRLRDYGMAEDGGEVIG